MPTEAGGWTRVRNPRALAIAAVLLMSGDALRSNPPEHSPFIEANFPFFSSVLDVRHAQGTNAPNNLTPRGLILNLGHECWAGFDLDLLRVAALWKGKGVTPVAMSQGSYHQASAAVKAPDGQRTLPKPEGELWLVNGIYPGWQMTSNFSLSDPRPPGPDPSEVGRGPLPERLGRFRSIRLLDSGVELNYSLPFTTGDVSERISAWATNGQTFVQRSFSLPPVSSEVTVALGYSARLTGQSLQIEADPDSRIQTILRSDGLWVAHINPSSQPVSFQVSIGVGPGPLPHLERTASVRPGRRWDEAVKTAAPPVTNNPESACTVEEIELPLKNPWRRNVRLADLAFDGTGRAAAVTFDGDVWFLDDLRDDLAVVRWTRFTSGLHEPLGIAFRAGELFVNDRNGIWRLRDVDRNGEADEHELFSSAFTQTAETREFATGLRLAPDGAFIISKGGQQSSTLGQDNGSVLRVAPDGRSSRTLGWGLRMPFIGVHPRTGRITASDQQGHYVPATPLHLIRDRQYYGYLSLLLPKEQYPAPIADPVTWIPHPVNASGASQVWLTGARMGPFNDAMIHLGYFRPEVFLVRWNERSAQPQAAVMSLTRDLSFAPLNGAVNPLDGLLYITGFQIWGTVAKNISGLARVRPAPRASTLPREIVPTKRGLLVRFDVPLEPSVATNPTSYSIERWNYQRSANYGSPHFRPDGSKGQESLGVSSVHLSRDGRSVFVAVPGLSPVMQMRLGWSLSSREGNAFASSAYFTPHDLAPLNLSSEGFEPFNPDSPRTPAVVAGNTAKVAATPDAGRRVAELMGCVACHSNDGSSVGKVGPTWKGLYGRKREIVGRGEILADEAYLRESIQDPPAKVPRGFEQGDIGMPSYDGVLTEAQIDALVAYLKSLQ